MPNRISTLVALFKFVLRALQAPLALKVVLAKVGCWCRCHSPTTGTLLVNGSGTNTQTFANTTFNAGASALTANLNSATSVEILLGTITRNAGGTVNVGATNATEIVNGTLTIQAAKSVLVSAASNGIAYMTVNGTDWATSSAAATGAGNVTAMTVVAGGYVTNATTYSASINDLLNNGNTTALNANETVSTLTFDNTAGNTTAETISETTTHALTINTGGILESSNSTGATISGTGTGNITAGAGNELVIFVENATAANGLTISAIIKGGIAVTKSGAGNLSLSGANTYTGATYLDQGTITLGSATALGTGTLNINGGTLNVSGALAVTNAQNWNANWTFTGSNTLTLGNSTDGTTLGANVVLTNSASTLTIAGAITGAFSLTETGGGTLALNGTNTFSGGLILNGGTLQLNSAAALGTGTFTITSGNFDNTNATLTTLSNNVAQVWNGTSFTFNGTHTLNMGTGAVALGQNETVFVGGNTLTVGGNIGGSTTSTGAVNTQASPFSLTLGNSTAGGSGTLVLSGNNSYNGGTIITNGTLVLSGNNIGTGNTTLNANGNLDINQGGNSTSSALGTGTLVINGGKIDNTSTGGNQTVATNNAVNLNSSFTYVGSNASLNLGTGNVTLGVTPTITVSGNTLTLDGVVSGAFGLTKAGAGDLVLGGNNTYTGATLVSAGTLELSANNALGVNALGTTVSSGATLQLDNGYQTGSGNSSSTGSLLTISGNGNGNGTVTAAALLNAATVNATSYWDGNIALSGNATISSGAGTSGCLTLGNGTALTNFTQLPLNYAGNISNISIGNNTLTFIGNAGTETFINSNITGNQGNVIVNTAGTVEYNSAANSYTGLTTIQNGTLIVNTNSNGSNYTIGQSNPALGGNLGILGNIVIGTTTGTGNTAILEIASGVAHPINYLSTVLVNQSGEFNTNNNAQTISNLTMNGGYITTGTGLLATNGNSSITIQANGNTSLISGNFNMGGAGGGTLTNINVTHATRSAVDGVVSDLDINATLTGGSFIQTGNGIVALTNQQINAGTTLVQNSFTGSAEVQGGTLIITASNALGASNNLANEGTQVDAGAQLQLVQTSGNAAIAVPNELLTLNGSGPGGAGALENVNGTNSWAGSVIANSSATINTAANSLNFTGTYSSNISSSTGATLTFMGAGNTTISTPLAGASNNLNLAANMSAGSSLFISNATTNNTYTGTTTVNSGILELQGNTTANTFYGNGSVHTLGGTALINNSNTLTVNTGGTLLTDTNNTLGPSVNMVLNGGTWETNAANAGGTGLTAFSSTNGVAAQSSFTETLNTLTLTANSNLTLGSGSNIINFAASNTANWTPGQTLYIYNWVGNFASNISGNYVEGLNGGGGQDQITFNGGTTETNFAGLDGSAYTGQLGEIIFVNPQDPSFGFNGLTGNFDAVITANGEVVPFITAVPEPGTVAAGASLAGLALLREWRRRKNRAAPAVVA